MPNDSIIPYVPIADRVEAKTPKSQQMCQQFFKMIDSCVRVQMVFSHDTRGGYLSADGGRTMGVFGTSGHP